IIFKPARESLHVRAKITDRREHRLVRRRFKQNFIARIHERRHREMIRKRRPRRGDNTLRRNSVARSNPFYQRLVTVTTSGDLEIVERHAQLPEFHVWYAARREVVLRPRLRLRPVHVRRHYFARRAHCVLLLDLQNQYAGSPASMIAMPISAFSGKLYTVLMATAQQTA